MTSPISSGDCGPDRYFVLVRPTLDLGRFVGVCAADAQERGVAGLFKLQFGCCPLELAAWGYRVLAKRLAGCGGGGEVQG